MAAGRAARTHMPALIPHIDTIARKRGRDGLCFAYHPQPSKQWREYCFQDDPACAKVLSWLDEHGEPGFRKRWAEDF